MTTFAPPVVAPTRTIVALADHLPEHLDYAAVRAPIAEGCGYAWFANRGIGRPVARWDDGEVVEENLFDDLVSFTRQIGLSE